MRPIPRRTAPASQPNPAPGSADDGNLVPRRGAPAGSPPGAGADGALPPGGATSIPSPPSAPRTQASASAEPGLTQEGFAWWPWLAAALALLALGAAALFYRRRGALGSMGSGGVGQAALAGGAGSPVPPPSPEDGGTREWARIDIRASQLRRSMMNMALSYRIAIINRSGRALENVSIEADLGTAHADQPVDKQIASAAVALPPRHTVARIAPGERLELEGEIAVPLSSIRVIRQGRAVVAVPLFRLRAVVEDRDPLAKTWVVGRNNPQASGRLLPFRMDDTPQTYRSLSANLLEHH